MSSNNEEESKTNEPPKTSFVQNEIPPELSRKKNEPCLECKIVGSGTLLALSFYSYYNGSKLPKGGNRTFQFTVSAVSFIAAVGRWFYPFNKPKELEETQIKSSTS